MPTRQKNGIIPLSHNRLFLLIVIYACGLVALTSCGGGGSDLYISPCFPFPASWCTSPPGDTTPPEAPTNLVAVSESPSTITLSWSAATDDNYVVRYNVYRDGDYVTYVASKTGYIDVKLAAQAQYCYSVTAKDNSDNESAKSNQSCATTLQDHQSPTVPGNLTVKYMVSDETGSYLRVAWGQSSDDGLIAGYRVYRDDVHIATTAEAAYLDHQIDQLTNYCYAVLATDASGNESEPTAKVCATSSWLLSIIKADEMPLYISLDADSNGNPGACYVSNGLDYGNEGGYYKTSDLKCVLKEQDGWSLASIDSYIIENLSDNKEFAHPVIRFDMSGNAHVAYVDYTWRAVKYASNQSGYWLAESALSDIWITGSSLVLDENGRAHIVYIDSPDVMYATNKTGVWEASLIETAENSVYYPAIAIDASGHLHVSYYEYHGSSPGLLKYATDVSGLWEVAAVDDSDAAPGYYPSITTDSGGNAQIIYYSADNRAMMHATHDAGVWTKTVIIDNVETDSASGVSADPAGNLHITCVDTLAHALMYSSNASGDWKSYPVDSSSFVQEKADITVGADGTVHIVYNGNTELRYATTSH